uniref:Uncharacterized protein n=1 Tax=Romanomermis culicivorax TaxID=13658 RepID=A0A915IIT0_ROMCU
MQHMYLLIVGDYIIWVRLIIQNIDNDNVPAALAVTEGLHRRPRVPDPALPLRPTIVLWKLADLKFYAACSLQKKTDFGPVFNATVTIGCCGTIINSRF